MSERIKEVEQYRLPKAVTEKWLVALRSGEYNQGTDFLFREFSETQYNSYCCLGVLGVVCGIEEFSLKNRGMLGDLDLKAEELPKELIDTKLAVLLAGMNDKGQSFATIADWIEENVELY